MVSKSWANSFAEQVFLIEHHNIKRRWTVLIWTPNNWATSVMADVLSPPLFFKLYSNATA